MAETNPLFKHVNDKLPDLGNVGLEHGGTQASEVLSCTLACLLCGVDPGDVHINRADDPVLFWLRRKRHDNIICK